jgi:hypothetical protein
MALIQRLLNRINQDLNLQILAEPIRKEFGNTTRGRCVEAEPVAEHALICAAVGEIYEIISPTFLVTCRVMLSPAKA